MAWYRQGAGQCGPCVFGLAALAAEMAALAHGRLPAGGLANLGRWGGPGRGAGGLPAPGRLGAAPAQALRAFPLDLQAHLGGRPCPASLGAGVVAVPGAVPGHPGGR